MEENSTTPRKAQLDKKEREHLEDVVTEMRERVEANVRYQLEEYDLEDRPDEDSSLSDEKEDLIKAIELEAVDGNEWEEGYEQYITGVGYTIVNRLAALRCMEVRDFIDGEVTRFRDDGLTPAADRLVTEEFMLEEEAVLEAYRNACDNRAEEIEILFDRSSAYSLIDPDDDTFEDLCGMLDEVSDEVWRADDVLGWVYEYYNVKLLDQLRDKARTEEYDPQDVPTANQFYTPHWVVRMLTDNSLGKLYLEEKGELQSAVETQSSLTPDERKNRRLSPDESPSIKDFCTYLVPSEEVGQAPEFDGPEDLRVIDPACGSGHFLLYAFDVLERIWRAETSYSHEQIPQKILEHNLYGVDLDMRACQLAAFNLYLKGRSRAEAEGANGFDMPEVGIVCADAKVADVAGVEEVFDEVADGRPDIEKSLRQILDAFEEIHGLGSLLDVRGTLKDLFEDEVDQESVQITLGDDPQEDHTLGQILHTLREAVDEHRDADSFLAQDLRSFIRLLDILAQDYDVALMNPPYGSRNRMPGTVQEYIESHYKYPAEFYINFFEVGDKIAKEHGRVGMLVPRSFMFKQKFEEFRKDFIGELSSFDFLAEFGIGILDNATVRTAGTVVRSDSGEKSTGTFLRLHDIGTKEKENTFNEILSEDSGEIKRHFEVDLNEFSKVPGSTLCYSTPPEVRSLHDTNLKLDAEQAGIQGDSIGVARQGVATADTARFIRLHWEVEDYDVFYPIASGGTDAWILPHIPETIKWYNNGVRIKRFSNTVRTPNEEYYGREALAWTYIKETGRRFGYYPGGLFSNAGYVFIPNNSESIWGLLVAFNSDLYHSLFLSITIERLWNAGEVGAIPWFENLLEDDKLENISQKQLALRIKDHVTNPYSPYYKAPTLYPKREETDFFYVHPHKNKVDDLVEYTNDSPSPEESIQEAARVAIEAENQRSSKLEESFEHVNQIIYDKLEVSTETQEQIRTEISLRTSATSDKRDHTDSDSKNIDNLNEQVKDLIHHFALESIREEDNGVIPIKKTNGQVDILDRIVERFEDAYGEYAEDRLIEVDDILGAESAADEAYPNLRAFVEKDLFAYHVDTMENTPILWKVSTERLLADAKGEGFACFVDYHQLDASLFDRLSNQYLEPRKAELRERRSAANQRRNDESLSTSERADATDEFEFCSSALEQTAELEEVMQELGSTSEREFNADDRERVSKLAPKVATFCEETAERIDKLEELREMNGEEWFQDTFSDGFWDKVNEWRDEWLDALDELEHACKEYAKPNDEPVEAHLADLFDYFNWRLKGSDHYSSTGVLFMTYYFEREGADLLNDDGEPFEKLAEDERMLASLAMGVDDASIIEDGYLEKVAADEDVDDIGELPPLAEFKALAEEIDDRCQTMDKQIPSDWSDRALSEITTAGYQPNQKHGVAINITPLKEKRVVPEIVNDKIL